MKNEERKVKHEERKEARRRTKAGKRGKKAWEGKDTYPSCARLKKKAASQRVKALRKGGRGVDGW